MVQVVTVELVVRLLLFLVEIALVYLGYKVIMISIARANTKHRIPLDAINGIALVVKALGALIITTRLLVLINPPPEFLISFSSVTGIIIGFASTEVVSQIVLGLYLISAEPFGIGHLVNINGIEGVVLEIGVNYTVIERFDGIVVQIPNKNVFAAQIRDYTLKASKMQSYLPEIYNAIGAHENIGTLRNLLDVIKGDLDSAELTHYTFMLRIKFDLEPKEVIRRLDRVCDKYATVFKFRPWYQIVDMEFQLNVLFHIASVNPYMILQNYSRFVQDISYSIDENRVDN